MKQRFVRSVVVPRTEAKQRVKIALRRQSFVATHPCGEATKGNDCDLDAGPVGASLFARIAGISRGHSSAARHRRFGQRPRRSRRSGSLAVKRECAGDERGVGLRAAGGRLLVAGACRNAAVAADRFRPVSTIAERLAVCSSRGASGSRSFVRFLTVFVPKTALLAVGVSPRRFSFCPNVQSLFVKEL